MIFFTKQIERKMPTAYKNNKNPFLSVALEVLMICQLAAKCVENVMPKKF